MDFLYKKYLFEDYYSKLKNYGLTPDENRAMLHKYNNILRIISTYIPESLVLRKIQKGADKKQSGRFVSGTLLFADVNGFTALTEKLSSHGYEGSEEITRILNLFFREMIQIIFKYRGDLLKYGGDAMMIFFSDEVNFCGDDHAYHAISCAMEMRDSMQQFALIESKFGNFPLKVSLSLHSDTFFESIIGDPDLHQEFFLTGNGVEQTAIIEKSTGTNEIVTDKNTFSLIEKYVKIFYRKEEFFRIESCNCKNLPRATKSLIELDFDSIDDILIRLDLLLPFATKGVYDKVRLSWESLVLEGEHRPVAILFLNYYFSGDLDFLNDNKNTEDIHNLYSRFFSMLQSEVQNFDGTINKIDMYTQGDKIIIIFGFPKTHSDDEKRALLCANAIKSKLEKFQKIRFGKKEISIHAKFGINSGFIFSGNVGSPLRQEYTIMGDAVNLAARLMSSAEQNQILISDSILKETREVAILAFSDLRSFKGKSEKIPVHAVSSIQTHKDTSIDLFVGREEELNRLMRKFSESTQQYGSMQIIAGAGIGKTFLIREFLSRQKIKFDLMVGRGLANGSHVPFFALKDILTILFGIIHQDDDFTIKEKIDKVLNFLQLKNLNFTIPLLGIILSKAYKDSPVLEIEDPIEKKELLFHTLFQIFQAKAKSVPVLMIFEDGEWLDHQTLELIQFLIKKRVPSLFILVLTRNELNLPKEMETLFLEPFSEKEAYDFIKKYPSTEKISPKIQKQIFEKSRGIPYFLLELLNSVRDHGIDARLPDSIYKSILARVDELSEEKKEFLKKASIFGVTFSDYFIKKIMDASGNVEKIINAVISEDFILKNNPGEYIFRNMMVQEVIYNLISVQKRRKLHLHIAQIYEQEGEISAYYEILAYHYEMAESYKQAILYFDKSGDKAVKLNQYQNAKDFFEKAISLMVYLDDVTEKWTLQADILGKIGKIFFIEKEISKSQEMFSRSYKISKEHNLRNELAYARFNLAKIFHLKYDYEKAESYYQKALSLYEELQNLTQLGHCYTELGLIAKDKNHRDEAQRYFELAVTSFQQIGNLSGAADTLNHLGNLSKENLDMEKALEYYQLSIRDYGLINHEIGKATIYNNIGTLHTYSGKYKEAIDHFNASLQIEEKIGNEKGKAVTYNNLGNAYLLKRNYDAADDFFIKALDICHRIQDERFLANLYLNRGVMYFYKEKYDSAKDLILNSINYFSALYDGHGLYNAFYNLGLIFIKDGRSDAALDSLQKALKEAQFLNLRIYSEASLKIAENYFYLGKFEDANTIIQSALDKAKDVTFLPLLYDLHLAASRYQQQIGKIAEAVQNLNSALRIKLDENDRKAAAYLGLQLAEMLALVGNTMESEEHLKQSLSFFQKSGDSIGKIFALNRMALLQESKKDSTSAIALYQENLAEISKIGLEHESPFIYKKIAWNYYQSGKAILALEFLQQALQIESKKPGRDSVESYIMMGNIFISGKKYEQALASYEKAFLSCTTGNSILKFEIAYNLAFLCQKVGDYRKAIGYFDFCISAQDEKMKITSLKSLAILYESVSDWMQLKKILEELKLISKTQETAIPIEKCLTKL